MNIFIKNLLLTLFVISCWFTINSQATERSQYVEALSTKIEKLLTENYVYPQKAEEMAKLLSNKRKQARYSLIDDNHELAFQLSKDLASIAEDKHLAIVFDPERVANIRKQELNKTEIDQKYLSALRSENYGFRQVKILDGNIGYLEINGFAETENAKNVAISAMNFLSNTDALIIDLRRNNGGQYTMVQLLSSYFFPATPTVHLSGFYWRDTNKYTQNWTLPYVPGKRLVNQDVYILTSDFTFSAAEEFSYNLKHLDRATIIGEPTRGGAHPSKEMIIDSHFLVDMPFGRSTNPITKTNWEGVGVEPDIVVPAANSLLMAHKLALESLAKNNKEESPKYQWYQEGLFNESQPVLIEESTLRRYVGQFGAVKLSVKKGVLYLQFDGSSKQPLIALTSTYFKLSKTNKLRLRILERNGEVDAIQAVYDDGYQRTIPRSVL